jgi:hypothetical protein
MGRPVGRLGGFFFVLVMLSWATVAWGATIVWDAAPGNVTGYKVYYGTVAGKYPYSVDVGRSTSRQLDNLPNLREGVLHYFSVTSYNESGESAFSAPISWTPPDKTPPSPPGGVTVRQ